MGRGSSGGGRSSGGGGGGGNFGGNTAAIEIRENAATVTINGRTANISEISGAESSYQTRFRNVVTDALRNNSGPDPLRDEINRAVNNQTVAATLLVQARRLGTPGEVARAERQLRNLNRYTEALSAAIRIMPRRNAPGS